MTRMIRRSGDLKELLWSKPEYSFAKQGMFWYLFDGSGNRVARIRSTAAWPVVSLSCVEERGGRYYLPPLRERDRPRERDVRLYLTSVPSSDSI